MTDDASETASKTDDTSVPNYCFIAWLDGLGSDPGNVEILAYEDEGADRPTQPPPVGQGDFVIVEDQVQNQQWFGQVLTAQLNLPLLGVNRENPSNLAALERVLRGEVSVSVFTRQVYYYQVRLLGQIVNNGLFALRIRPRAGSKGRQATQLEVIRYLGLPAIEDEDVAVEVEIPEEQES